MGDLKADWRTLEAGRELDRVIAETLGWTNCHLSQYSESYLGNIPIDQNPTHQWMHEATWSVPNFSTNLDAAFTLFHTELGLEWNLFSDYNGITCELGHWNNEPGQADQVEQWNDKTAALAIVKAWLSWQERTDHPAPELPKGTES